MCETSAWVLVKEFDNCSMNDRIRDWVLCILDSKGIKKDLFFDWVSSSIGRCKVNFDGASFGNLGPAGFECVMRDSQGLIIGVKGGPLGCQDAIYAETMGLLEGLKLAKDKGVRDYIIEGDSLTVISWGKGDKVGSWRLHHHFTKIKVLIMHLGAELRHVPRAQNFFADKIAKWSVDQPVMFEGEGDDFSDLLM